MEVMVNKHRYILSDQKKKTNKYSNTEIIKILPKPNEFKLSQIMPVKPKDGEVYVIDWQGDKKKIKDYVADQYIWVSDSTKAHLTAGINLVKNTTVFMMILVKYKPGRYHIQETSERLFHTSKIILLYN